MWSWWWRPPSHCQEGRTTTASQSPPLSEEELKARLEGAELPRHIAVIMDGNGRWAQERGLPRFEGHRAARRSIRETVEACGELGVDYLTLYAFSAENWSRPKTEVDALMVLIEATLREEAAELHASKVRVRGLGKREGLPDALLAELKRVEAMTGENDGLTLQIAVNYGGRQEIIDAAVSLARDVASGKLSPEEIDESRLAERLYRPDAPDPDLLIRSGGEHRVSNYLLWEIAYTEIYVTPVLWPDFRKVHLYQALVDYHGRQRRFGGVTDVA